MRLVYAHRAVASIAIFGYLPPTMDEQQLTHLARDRTSRLSDHLREDHDDLLAHAGDGRWQSLIDVVERMRATLSRIDGSLEQRSS